MAVGLEGVWGMLLCLLAMPFLPAIKDAHGRPMDDLPAAIREVRGALMQQCTGKEARERPL